MCRRLQRASCVNDSASYYDFDETAAWRHFIRLCLRCVCAQHHGNCHAFRRVIRVSPRVHLSTDCFLHAQNQGRRYQLWLRPCYWPHWATYWIRWHEGASLLLCFYCQSRSFYDSLGLFPLPDLGCIRFFTVSTWVEVLLPSSTSYMVERKHQLHT